MREGIAPPAIVPAESRPQAGTDDEVVRAAERDYEQAIVGLEQVAQAEGHTLDPALAAALNQNIAIVDRAIGDAREAVGTDPQDEELRAGGAVVYPTETLYGLGVDATDDAALQRLVRLKGREPGKPISVLVSDAAMLGRVAAAISPAAERLMRRFWPGALTLVLPAAPHLSDVLTGGTGPTRMSFVA